jgi:hypothetical protein
MGDVEQRSRQAETILDAEVFEEVCNEIEKEAIDGVRSGTSNEELIFARAKLLSVGLVRKKLEVIRDRAVFERARTANKALA